MVILQTINVFSFVPGILFAGVLWSNIRRKEQFGTRPRYLLFSILLFTVIGAVLFQYRLFSTFWEPAFSFSLFATVFALYLLMFFVLEYSIHCQRIKKSHVWNDFIGNLKRTIIYWAVLTGIIAGSYFMVYLYKKNLFTGGFISLFIKSDDFAALKARGEVGLADLGVVMTFVSVLYTVTAFLLIRDFRKKVFHLQTGVARTNNLTFNVALVFLLLQFGYCLFFEGVLHPLYTEIFFVLTVVYIIRVYMEYFCLRVLNLERTIDKQDQSAELMNELVSREASSPIEEDVEILRSTISEELRRLKNSLPNRDYAFSGFMLYSLEGDILKVISPQLINGFCTPLLKHSTIKLLKNTKQIQDSILKTVYDVKKIGSLALQDLTDWGEQIIKELIRTRERIVINQIPDELKGLQRLIAVNPLFDKERLIGILVVFKDSFDKLFPEEENVLTWLCGNLKIILTIIDGKRIQRERNRLSNEMNIAKNIQTSILPAQMEIPGFRIATNMVTASEVGGDVYDCFCTELGNYIGIGDVSGHGLPAGIMALIQLVAFEAVVAASQAVKKKIAPHELYDIVNKLLCKINRDRIGSDKFMTQNYILENKGTLTHAGAHEIALLYRKKQDKVIEMTDFAKKAAFMGITETATAKASEGSFTMHKGDLLLLYTDGAIQAKDDYGNQFGIDGLKKILGENSSSALPDLIEKIMGKIYNHALNGDIKKYRGNFADDVSLVLLRKT